MKFLNSGNMDFELPRANKGNYFYGNIIIPTDKMIGFQFDSNLQLLDFILEKLIFDEIAMTYSWSTVQTLDNSYKKEGYFETHTLNPVLTVGIYRLKVGTYYSANMFDVKAFTVSVGINAFIDNENNQFVDNNSEPLIETI